MIMLTATASAIILPWPLTARCDEAHPVPSPRHSIPGPGRKPTVDGILGSESNLAGQVF